ncbi:ribonuclease HII [Salirhabdus euzebyi]|uniref:Ribonuclease HII n=1 Tax=Salirhabdus euzebyi TaxID=394506 RepID=A0A841Q3J2_9BACI|nr:ribonuclease HII [Salirhabdus euzebyi]MBB6452942.1 ribonuclease HII [Salirhabdus euzebyi]
MKYTMTIEQIKEKIHTKTYTDDEWSLYKNDERKGVQALIEKHEKKEEEKRQLQTHFQEMLTYENTLWSKGFVHVAGIDEAGRGPLAGPVVAASVIIDEHFYIEGLNDSKKLSESKRELFFDLIKEQAITYGIGIVDSKMIDQINIFQATKLAMKQAILDMAKKADYLLIDAVKLNEVSIRQHAIIKGDQKSISIAAASVIAKVTRDQLMKKYDEQYPQYQFGLNMGYGTKAHLEALETYGPTPIHRVSFTPVKEANR